MSAHAVVRQVVPARVEPVALRAFRWETRRRLRALAAYLAVHPSTDPGPRRLPRPIR